uniref:VOC domain-containing protein n=1 Tax=Oncorhynchus kisutch TaxID=8019 RepID=A0A8C7DCX8_ONCKI
MALRSALHFGFKVGDRSKTITFYRDVLGMTIFCLVGPHWGWKGALSLYIYISF